MSICEWSISEIDEEIVSKYSQKYGIPYVSVAILYSRGFREESDIQIFLQGTVEDNVFDITDMDKAVQRIEKAIKENEKICIYGDYDADGITSSSLMCRYLRDRGADVFCYIPERNKDGYGLNNSAIEYIKNEGTNLIITVDNGISAFDEVKYANLLGMDVVITDHHRVRETLPCACAVVNPYRKECSELKNKNFAGVGVAFKLIEALETGRSSKKELLNKYSDLVTVGTIGDSIELFGETKEVVKYGLENLLSSQTPGIISLLKCSNLYLKELDSISVAFGIVPRINACGRMDNARLALELLMCDDVYESDQIAVEVCKLNDLRKNIENEILEDVEKLLLKEPERKYEKIIVAEGENWNHGVLGIVASKITQKYGKPCILITIEGETSRASCRSVEGFSIYDALVRNSKWLTRFGGHPMAAGFSINTSDLKFFKESLFQDSENYEVPALCISIDFELEPYQISCEILEDLEILKPYGNGNPEPVFGIFGATLVKIIPIGKGKHLKLVFEKDGFEFSILYFNKTPSDFIFSENEKLDIAITLHENEYMGVKSVSCYAVDFKICDYDLKKAVKEKNLYQHFKKSNMLNCDFTDIIPSREEFVKIYQYVKKLKNKSIRVDLINKRLFNNSKNLFIIYIVLDVMEELGLIRIFRSADEYKIIVNEVKEKVNISDSLILKSIKCEKEN